MRFLFLSIALLVSAPAFADPTLECDGSGSQVEIGACVNETGARVEQALEIALTIAQGSADELDDVTGRTVFRPALDAAQVAWVAFRRAHCDAVGASYGGGSGTGIAIAACRIDLGRDRIEALLRMGQ